MKLFGSPPLTFSSLVFLPKAHWNGYMLRGRNVCSYKRSVCILVLLLSIPGVAIALEEVKLQAIKETYKADQITQMGDMDGLLRMAGNDYPYSVKSLPSLVSGNGSFDLFIVEFPKLQEQAVETYYRSAKLPPRPPVIPRLFCLGVAPDLSVFSVPMDERAVYSVAKQSEVLNFLGLEHPQLKLMTDVIYIDEARSITVYASRKLLFELPSLSLRFAGTVERKIVGRLSVKEELQRIEFNMGTSSKGGEILISALGKGKSRIITANSLSDTPDLDTPWIVSEDFDRGPVGLPEEICVQVVSEDGKPIEGAQFFLERGIVGRKFFSGDKEEEQGLTDGDGKFCVEPGIRTSIVVKFPGRYTYKQSWSLKDYPPPNLRVVLNREEKPVEMLKNRCHALWKEAPDTRAIGISFNAPKSYDSINIGGAQLGNDIEIHVEQNPRYLSVNNSGIVPLRRGERWLVNLDPQNGWRIAPANALGLSRDDPDMRLAPMEGYEDSLSYVASEIPVGFFLEKDGGQRYGKLYGLRVEDSSKGDGINIFLEFAYAVQVNNEGTRSLNPLTKK